MKKMKVPRGTARAVRRANGQRISEEKRIARAREAYYAQRAMCPVRWTGGQYETQDARLGDLRAAMGPRAK